jgi:hypothetical protein
LFLTFLQAWFAEGTMSPISDEERYVPAQIINAGTQGYTVKARGLIVNFIGGYSAMVHIRHNLNSLVEWQRPLPEKKPARVLLTFPTLPVNPITQYVARIRQALSREHTQAIQEELEWK